MSNDIQILFTFLSIFLLIAVIGYILPNYLRKDLLFGIRINEIESLKIKPKYIKHHFKQSYIMMTFMFFLIAIWLLHLYPREAVGSTLVIFQIILFYLLLAIYNRKVLSIKIKIGSRINMDEMVVVDSKPRDKEFINRMKWFVPSFLLVLIHFVLVILLYEHIPEIISLKFGLFGNLIEETEKTWNAVLRLPVASLFIFMIFLLLRVVVKYSKQQFDSQFVEASRERLTVFQERWIAFFAVMLPILLIHNIVSSLIYLNILELESYMFFAISFAVPMVFVVLTLILAVKTGQSGSKILTSMKGKRSNQKIYDDDKFWKLGLFYFNPNDPTIFIEKRMGIGWTINMANPIAVGGLIMFCAVIGILIKFVN